MSKAPARQVRRPLTTDAAASDLAVDHHQPFRKQFDRLLKDGKAALRTDSDTDIKTFLQACLDFSDETELLLRLTNPNENGLHHIVVALTEGPESTQQPVFLDRYVMPFLKQLLSDRNSHGMMKSKRDQLLTDLFDIPLVREYLLMIVSMVHDPLPLAQLVHEVLVADGEDAAKMRKTHEKFIKQFLAQCASVLKTQRNDHSTSLEALLIAIQTVIQPAVATSTSSSSSSSSQPGGRHNNDHPNYRDIQIAPTEAEMASTASPYLPFAPESSSTTLSAILDRNFRLMRGDLLVPLKEEMQEGPRFQYHGARVCWYDTGREILDNGRSQQSSSRGFFQISFRHRGSQADGQEQNSVAKFLKKEWWEKHARELQRNAFVCLVDPRRNNSPICFGQVWDRNELLLAKQTPRIGIVPASRRDLDTLLQLWLSDYECTLIHCNSSYFSSQPILRELQRISSLPFLEELTSKWPWGKIPQKPKHFGKYAKIVEQIQKSNQWQLKSKQIELDPSQQQAMINGLSHRFCLIQGPPGTGKSFIGALLAKVLHDETDGIILCVCHTNHGLDQFLLDLLDHGFSKANMKRIGGNKVHSDLEDVRLETAAREVSSASFNRQYATIIKEIEACQDALENLLSYRRSSTKPSMSEVLDYLGRNEPEWSHIFTVPASVKRSMSSNSQPMDGVDLLEFWLDCRMPDPYYLPNNLRVGDIPDVWDLAEKERLRLYRQWCDRTDEKYLNRLYRLCTALETAQKDMQLLKSESKALSLQGVRVIGCTTTGAAIYRELLQTVPIKVLLVEEAGEILEPAVLTALSPCIEHAIFIGDHQQLRPKVNSYKMQVASRRGYDLDCSLFERLVRRSNYPHVTLQKQHRMHPDIARLVRGLVYPNLENAPNTNQHPMPKGLQARVVFINHNQFEDNCVDMKQRSDEDTSSKVNSHEVKMILATTKYLLQQGYKPEDLVVLTPYLGQLSKLRDAFSAERGMGSAVGELDTEDLVSSEVKRAVDPAPVNADSSSSSSLSSSTTTKHTVRIATIDNYQGEEAKIVLISLVRSNANGDIGFVAQEERVNVMLSRAREAMVLIGNRSTLETCSKSIDGRQLWGKLFKMLDAENQVFTGLPVSCQRHPQQNTILTSPQDFVVHLSPNGGCKLCGSSQ